jgi:hypothetical protein
MESSQQLANRFREVILDGEWIANTNLQKLIGDLSWEQAKSKIGDHNSIAQLTFHIDYYIGGVCQVLKGGPLEIRDKYSFDMSAFDSESGWLELKNQLARNAKDLASEVETMSEDQLDSDFVDPKYGSYRRNIEGLIEHSYYHMGQISLIKKLLNTY